MTAALKAGNRQEVRRSEVVASSSKTPKVEKKHGLQPAGRVIHSGASHGARTKAEVESKRVNSIEPTQKCLCQNEVACVCPVEAVRGAKHDWEVGFDKKVRAGGEAERTRKAKEETERQKRDDGNKREGKAEAEEKRRAAVQANRDVANKKAQEAEALMIAALKTDLGMKTDVGQVDIRKTAAGLKQSNARWRGQLKEVLVEALTAAKEQVGHQAAMRLQSSWEHSKATSTYLAPVKERRARSSCFRCGSGFCVNFDCIADVPFDCMEDAEVGAGYQLKSKEEITAEITAEKTRKKQAQVDAAKDAREAMAEERRALEAAEAAEAAAEKTRIGMPFDCMEDVGEPPCFEVKKEEHTDFEFEKTSSEALFALPDTADALERIQKVKAAVPVLTVETLAKPSVQRAAGEEKVAAGNTGSKFAVGPSGHAEHWPSLSQTSSGTHRLRCARHDCPCAAGVLFRTGSGCTHRL